MFFNLEKQLKKGRSFQPSFNYKKILISFIGAFIAINLLAVISIYRDQSLLIAPFGASTVLLFGIEGSPLAQPRNLIIGNLMVGFQLFFLLTVLGITLFLADLRLQLL